MAEMSVFNYTIKHRTLDLGEDDVQICYVNTTQVQTGLELLNSVEREVRMGICDVSRDLENLLTEDATRKEFYFIPMRN